jgi:hypothetical protein
VDAARQLELGLRTQQDLSALPRAAGRGQQEDALCTEALAADIETTFPDPRAFTHPRIQDYPKSVREGNSARARSDRDFDVAELGPDRIFIHAGFRPGRVVLDPCRMGFREQGGDGHLELLQAFERLAPVISRARRFRESGICEIGRPLDVENEVQRYVCRSEPPR